MSPHRPYQLFDNRRSGTGLSGADPHSIVRHDTEPSIVIPRKIDTNHAIVTATEGMFGRVRHQLRDYEAEQLASFARQLASFDSDLTFMAERLEERVR